MPDRRKTIQPDSTPVPVEILAPTPVPVEITKMPVQKQQSQITDPSKAAQTTFQEDLTADSQRKVNFIWEFTQAAIAMLVIIANMIVGVSQGMGFGADREYPIILSSSLFLIVGFYFSRTNHTAIGGVGPKPNELQQYKGR